MIILSFLGTSNTYLPEYSIHHPEAARRTESILKNVTGAAIAAPAAVSAVPDLKARGVLPRVVSAHIVSFLSNACAQCTIRRFG